jgi:putative peptide maturation dehydrogenase
MPRYRRTAYAFLYCHDTGFLDIELLLRGTAEPITLRQVLGLSVLGGSPSPLSRDELDLFLHVPCGEWGEPSAGEEARCEGLARKGLLVSDTEDDEELAELRRRDELLARDQWHVFASFFHFFTRWRGKDVWPELPEAVDLAAAEAELVRRWGPPPSPFHARGGATVPLPRPQRREPFYELLERRRTTRAFALEDSMSSDELSVLLHYTFGCQGYAHLDAGLVALRRTSPSGGGLHPTEAYPLVRDVDGLEPGFYHYDAGRHVLEPVRLLPANDVRELAIRLAAGQPFAGDAHALVLLTSRFGRSFWKYRKHDRAYAVLLLDAGHLSQTFYLVSAALGLGAFVTAAINGADAEEELGLDGFSEGALALCGCGKIGARGPLDPEFLRYVAGETNVS